MDLKRQDVVLSVFVGMSPSSRRPITFAEMSAALAMSASQVHSSVRRARECGLLGSPMPLFIGERGPRVGTTVQAFIPNLLEFLEHGLRFVFPAQRRGITRGLPTAEGAPILGRKLLTAAAAPVWPLTEGRVRGEELAPLYRNVPHLALQRPELHDAFALVDLLRVGGARERKLAGAELKKLFAGSR